MRFGECVGDCVPKIYYNVFDFYRDILDAFQNRMEGIQSWGSKFLFNSSQELL